jgi:glucose 1-dehydrogenase
LITGAGQGIGRAIALKFAKEGTSVIVNNVTEDRAKSVSKEIEEMGGSATPIQADVAHQDEVTNMVSKVMDEFGKIDILVNNAGIQTSSPFLKMSIAEWDRIIDVNLKGTFLCSQLVANNMIKNNYGKIVNIASIHYIIPRLNRIHYDVSKAGIAIMTKEMALELAKYKINVNCIAPGFIATEMNKEILGSPVKLNENISRIPWGRIGEPEDIAKAALFLVSDEAEYVTGAILNVDGGLGLK